MSSTDSFVILEAPYYQSLISNRKMLIENIIFTEEMIKLSVERKIISGDNVTTFQKSQINAERVDCIIQSLQMRQSKYFLGLCEILTVCGQPLISQIIQESVTNVVEVDIEEILNEMPILKKSLRQKDKDQLQKYIIEKVKSESVKSIVTHSKSNQRKESIARVTQIQQSWKFQNEIKGKEKESIDLKEQLISVEDQLVEKQEQLKMIKKELEERQQKQQSELLLATKFNSVNDKELQRSENSLQVYKKTVDFVITKIRRVVPEGSKTFKHVMHESSENQIKKYDVETQMNIFNQLVDKMLEVFNILSSENLNYEALKSEVCEVKALLFPHREHNPVDNLTSYINDYQKMVSSTVKTLQSKIEMQENFIFGKIPPKFIPVQFTDIQIPSYEREEFFDIIKELKTTITNLESRIVEKEKDFENIVKHKNSGETDRSVDSNKPNGYQNQKTNSQPATNQDQIQSDEIKRTDIAQTKHKSKQSRVYENKSKRNSIMKIGSVKF